MFGIKKRLDKIIALLTDIRLHNLIIRFNSDNLNTCIEKDTDGKMKIKTIRRNTNGK
jgi:hypothetical protein